MRISVYTIDNPDRPGHGETHRLVTTLLDDAFYPATELIALYQERCEIEIANDEIKTHQVVSAHPTNPRSRTSRGPVREIYGMLIAFNAVRRVMFEKTMEMYPRRVKFTDSVRVIREAATHIRAAPIQELFPLYEGMRALMADKPLPHGPTA